MLPKYNLRKGSGRNCEGYAGLCAKQSSQGGIRALFPCEAPHPCAATTVLFSLVFALSLSISLSVFEWLRFFKLRPKIGARWAPNVINVLMYGIIGV